MNAYQKINWTGAESAMAHCEHHDVCGRDADENTGDGLCILHSDRSDKDQDAFDKALAEHRDPEGPNRANKDNFGFFVFLGDVDFREAWFRGDANFAYARFHGKTDFNGALFDGKVDFRHAELKGEADFNRAKLGDYAHFGSAEFTQAVFELAQFRGRVYFSGVVFGDDKKSCGVNFLEAEFNGKADFRGATFIGPARFNSARFMSEANFWGVVFGDDKKSYGVNFSEAEFGGTADFHAATITGPARFNSARFVSEANFEGTVFTGPASFPGASFQGRTLFLPHKENGKIVQVFSGAEVDFRWVILEPLDGLVMRDADLSKCQFLGTDLRKAEITGATWPKIPIRFPVCGTRDGVYDESLCKGDDSDCPCIDIERLYRELKQNFEDRRDFDRAGDFHYGEKEMRLLNNKEPRPGRRLLLWLYRCVSGYGERCLPPIFWMVAILLVTTFCYFFLDLLRVSKESTLPLDWRSIPDVFLYSLRVMLLLKPDEFVCTGSLGRAINTLQSVVGPLLVGLFALAVRQRLKR